ncbi:flagellar basal body-associated FliL family protein [Ectothiorhodospira mobilis]|uniref:flagellar basal body-associated FliL family protein n=1 Tax=Ectothiorhodospira mobilis TaxID=195064 RepID=UPI001903C5FA|nr:flagellar basal body-associated FliL family protein [Ectothiorhodospira mobilis]MBK1690695.1 flagellar basal body protein FliL [Ectothiorhodospira mobilis]
MAKRPEKKLNLEAGNAKPKGGRLKLILLILLSSLLAAGVGGGAAWYLLGGMQAQSPSEPAPKEPGYLALDPPLVVNFQGNGRVRFLQVGVVLMARDPQVLKAAQEHLPAIRNDLMLLFGDERYEALLTREGKEAVRQEALEAVRQVLMDRGEPADVQAIYFNSFVMQ